MEWEGLSWLALVAVLLLGGYIGFRYFKGWLDRKNGK